MLFQTRTHFNTLLLSPEVLLGLKHFQSLRGRDSSLASKRFGSGLCGRENFKYTSQLCPVCFSGNMTWAEVSPSLVPGRTLSKIMMVRAMYPDCLTLSVPARYVGSHMTCLQNAVSPLEVTPFTVPSSLYNISSTSRRSMKAPPCTAPRRAKPSDRPPRPHIGYK